MSKHRFPISPTLCLASFSLRYSLFMKYQLGIPSVSAVLGRVIQKKECLEPCQDTGSANYRRFYLASLHCRKPALVQVTSTGAQPPYFHFHRGSGQFPPRKPPQDAYLTYETNGSGSSLPASMIAHARASAKGPLTWAKGSPTGDLICRKSRSSRVGSALRTAPCQKSPGFRLQATR